MSDGTKHIDLTPFHIPENSSEPIDASVINLAFSTLQNYLNAIPGAAIEIGTIPLAAILEGGVKATSVSSTGEINKIVQRDANGDLKMPDGGKLFFQFTN